VVLRVGFGCVRGSASRICGEGRLWGAPFF